MTRKKTLILIGILLVVGAGAWFYFSKKGKSQDNFQFTEVKRGDIQSVVSSTGTLSALVTVQVGTQVSGIIAEIHTDFNQHVSKGQLLAVLDKQALNAAVRDAQATVDRAKAQLAQAQDDYDRNEPLLKKGYLSAEEFNGYRGSVAVSKASLQSAQAALDRANTNLGYAEIRSPINGTVIQRSVDVGQTVAASLSTPTLFLIAQDLSHMQIDASVDESDIGTIKEGQHATFTVQAYPDKQFEGTVQQIRLQPTTVQNVVNYTVVVNTENPEGILIPGMTATINFEVQSAKNVLTVPNAALRFQPTAEMLAASRAQSGTTDSARTGRRSGAGTAGTAGGTGAGGTGAGGTGAGGAAAGDSSARRMRTGARNVGRLWTVDSTGNLRMIMVKIGLSDGQVTQVDSPKLQEGMKVISGIAQPASATKPATGAPSALPGAGGAGAAGRGGAGGGRGGLF